MTGEPMKNKFSCAEFSFVYSPYEKITTNLYNDTK